MENNLEISSIINKDNLKEDNYFPSLVEECSSKNLISADMMTKLSENLSALLLYKVKEYLGDKSSSMPKETAEMLMNTCIYTLGVYLKSLESPAAALEVLKSTDLMDIYNRGKTLIKCKLKTIRHLHNRVLYTMVPVNNYIYKSTLDDGIHGFIKKYNPDVDAADTIITADYPLTIESRNLSGVEFIENYLGNAYYENLFCSYFKGEDIHHLLLGFHENYKELVFNIFQMVLTCALGCCIAEVSVENLYISPSALHRISSKLQSKDETSGILTDALRILITRLAIENKGLIVYLQESLKDIEASIAAGLEINKLDAVFVRAVVSDEKTEIRLSMDSSMDDDSYRALVEEIISCRYLEDKLALIKDQIKTFKDMKDILIDGEFQEKEILEILKTLEPLNISALMKLLMPDEISEDGLREEELVVYYALKAHIASLPQELQKQIIKGWSLIIIE